MYDLSISSMYNGKKYLIVCFFHFSVRWAGFPSSLPRRATGNRPTYIHTYTFLYMHAYNTYIEERYTYFRLLMTYNFLAIGLSCKRYETLPRQASRTTGQGSTYIHIHTYIHTYRLHILINIDCA